MTIADLNAAIEAALAAALENKETAVHRAAAWSALANLTSAKKRKVLRFINHSKVQS